MQKVLIRDYAKLTHGRQIHRGADKAEESRKRNVNRKGNRKRLLAGE
jgi:hypothetical protein